MVKNSDGLKLLNESKSFYNNKRKKSIAEIKNGLVKIIQVTFMQF